MKTKKSKGEKIHTVLMICPECNVENRVRNLNYNINKDDDGISFLYQCSLCKKKFEIDKKFRDM